jgi:hypothetical protein
LHHAVAVLGAGLVVRDYSGSPAEPLAGRYSWPCKVRVTAVMD